MNMQQQPKQSNNRHKGERTFSPLTWVAVVVFFVVIIVAGLITSKTRPVADTVSATAVAQNAIMSSTANPDLPPLTAKAIEDLRAKNAEILTSYGWVDKDAGIARIPVDKAMEMALAQADNYYKQWEVEAPTPSAGGGDAALAEAGAAAFDSLGCGACHALDKVLVGPAIGAIFGTQVELESGETVTVNEEYLRTSILAPNDAIVKGFPPAMPPFDGLVSEDQLAQLIAFIKSTGGDSTAAADSGATAAMGEELSIKAGCTACHAVDSVLVGPEFAGLFGSEVTLESGETVTADEAYIRESILTPNAKVVQGFPPAMPPFEGLLSDADVASLIEYIKSLAQ